MIPLLALAAAAQVAPAPARFSDVPGVRVTYYDVAGRTVPEIYQSLSQRAPKDPVTHKPVPATSHWTIGASARTVTSGGRCGISAATATLQSDATMPRLAPSPDLPAPVLAAWQRYATELEAQQASQLRFAYDHLDEVRKAILASSCTGWQQAASAAITRIEEQQRLAASSAGSPPRLVP